MAWFPGMLLPSRLRFLFRRSNTGVGLTRDEWDELKRLCQTVDVTLAELRAIWETP
jgi:hypothetical protein